MGASFIEIGPMVSLSPARAKSKLGAVLKGKPAPTEKPRCGMCGHWSTATEYGVDDRSGYCDRWEKLTQRDFVCDEFVSRQKFQQMQQDLVEQNEEFMDDET